MVCWDRDVQVGEEVPAVLIEGHKDMETDGAMRRHIDGVDKGWRDCSIRFYGGSSISN